MGHDQHGPLFSSVSSCLEKELLGQDIFIPDDEATAEARQAAEEQPVQEKLLFLAARLSFQQRHRESAEVCKKIIEADPSCYAAHRRLGLNYMKTLQHDKACQEFFWCLDRTEDLLDIYYRLGLSLYYQEKYEQAGYWFISCFGLCENDGEMYIAVLYWYILCLIKQQRKDLDAFLKEVDPGHHAGYQLFVHFVRGELTKQEMDIRIPSLDLLNQTCVAYALYVWYEKEQPILSQGYMQHMLSCSALWGSFSFLAGYTEYLRRESIHLSDQRNNNESESTILIKGES